MGTVLENIMCARPRGHLHGREAIKDKAYPYLQTGQVGDGSGSPLFYVTGDYGTGNAASRRRRRIGICKLTRVQQATEGRGKALVDRPRYKQPRRALPTLHMFLDLETCGMTSEPIIIRSSCRRPSCRRPSCAAALHDATTNLHYSADTWLAPRHPGR